MKLRKTLRHVIKEANRFYGREKIVGLFSRRNIAVMLVLSLLIVILGFKISTNEKNTQVYAAAETEDEGSQESQLPTGIAGVVASVSEAPSVGSTIRRIGTSFEKVMVGQRVTKIKDSTSDFDLKDSMENTVNSLDAAVYLASSPKLMSDTDYDTLLRIVEAEAGTEDVKGRILVANVIMNRVKSEEFPNTVTEVVWDYSYGVAQFSPTSDGRIGEVTVTDETKDAVRQALEGVDYSEGALFFVQKSAADKDNVAWFEKDLKKLFKYGVHEFYRYPTEEEKKSAEKKEKKTNTDEDVVQMVMNDTNK